MATDRDEILLVPFVGQGHLFPFIELGKHLSKRDYKITLIIPSSLTSTIPSSLTVDYPLIQIAELPTSSSNPHPPPPQPPHPPSEHGKPKIGPLDLGVESLLSARPQGSRPPVCAVIDTMMGGSRTIVAKFGVPVVSLFTSSASCAAMDYVMWEARVSELKPGEIRGLPGLPDELTVSYNEVNIFPPDHIPGGGPKNDLPESGPDHEGKSKGPPPMPPPRVGGQPGWLTDNESVAILFNTCYELEGVYLDYVAPHFQKPVWGVGPLLPEQYWRRSSSSSSSPGSSSILRDSDFRQNKQHTSSSHSEEEVIQWLDSKPHNSVLYIAFGTLVGPSMDELAELATALTESSNQNFIWVIRPGLGRPGPPPPPGSSTDDDQKAAGYYPHGLDARVGDRGLIIHGWASQLLILSHSSTGGFLSHCGWNSTVEAIGNGVPLLAWPCMGDQFNNAKMVTAHLKIGYLVKEKGPSQKVKKDDIVNGIQKLMGDEEVKRRARLVKKRLEGGGGGGGFPKSSEGALDAFKKFVDTTKK